MAKFLKQSGLDTILNETGPYTIFVPTDKAFRTLLIQLGGPERAEEKFKENPRLLSGLLLHHVIPGAFKINSLQDEMTGVSLAGTQLRVNQYAMHDKEWNDIKITTINGAKISEENQDIEIPQGVAHAIDKVMFPLPVGDIVQTLQSDRERRFTSLLRAIFASGLNEMLQSSKIFTLIAPTEKAFAALSTEDLSKLVTDKVLARELVLRHVLSGTLYTNGMRYYQIKDSLLQDRQITFSKQTGKVKVNNNLLTTQNIPATNGVIHAIDNLL
ncbi:transforming growth factor-beta-induced protein ig-h3-like isoform X2 [Diorhabda carinulata]|nr:transforming growth factor-beta-induced protein ig-h3-like isoform X2 [Diorhabda carinulata]